MDILFFAAFVAPVVALVERNHRRNTGLPSTVLGAADDRDLDRVRHDVAAAGSAPACRRRARRTSAQSAPAVCGTAVG